MYGTTYPDNTPPALIAALEDAIRLRYRVTLDLGDPATGRSWGEVYDITGYIGRSMGPQKVPILVHNSRSIGGGAILLGNILSIRHANKRKGGFIYKRSA